MKKERVTVEVQRELFESYRAFFRTSKDPVFITSKDGRWIDCNDATVELFGYENRDELFNANVAELYANPTERNHHVQLIEEQGFLKEYPLVLRKKDGNTIHALVTSVIRRDAQGNVIGYQGTLRDITDFLQTKNALQKSEQNYRVLFEENPSICVIISSDGLIRDVNKTTLNVLGYAKDEVVDKSASDFIIPEKREYAAVKLAQIFKGDKIPWNEVELIAKDGFLHTIWFSHVPLIVSEEGLPQRILVTGQDISELKRVKVSLLESEEKYRTLVERANDGILIIQDFLIKYANKRLKEMLGVITKEITGTPFTNYLPSKEHSKLADNYKRRMAGEYVPSIYETSFICADGTTKEIEINAGLITYMGKPADLVLIRDITDRKRIEEALRKSEEIFRGIYEISPIGIELYDSNGQLTHANRACLGIFGVNDFAEVKDFKLFEDPNLPYEQKERLHKGESVRYEVAFDFEKVKIFELYRTTKTGIIHLDVLITPLNVSSEGSTEGYLVQVQDITKRKWAEEQIKAALGEKEILLREIHHRVKNNLQIISTLLYLQSGYVKDKEALEMFNESLNRVKSMALIHEKLYQFEDLGKIDFAEYIRNLTTDLFHSYGVNQDDIKLKIPIHEILLNINTAIPCGLIINELVSNSLKHAFPDGREGKICIDLHYLVTDNIFTLTVSDNGIGFLKDLDFRKTETLGLQLVITLVEQLKGTIELDRNAGTEFKVTFVKK